MNNKQAGFQVIVVYSDPRGGTWYGPVETLDKAEQRLALERSRVRGFAYIVRASGFAAFLEETGGQQ